jgi:putative endonuclease
MERLFLELYYVYIVQCEDDSFYTGYSKDIESRMKHHKEGKGARYTKMHKPERLVYVEIVDSRKVAMRRERQIKKLNHHRKLKLLKSEKNRIK